MRSETLVSVSRDGVTGAVVRNEDGVWLADDREPGRIVTTVEHGRVAHTWMPGATRIVGGWLPAGAVRAVAVDVFGEEVEAVCGGGAWVAAAVGYHIPVRFEDAGGRIVRVPIPETWAREPVDDATEPCSACGARDWERVTPDDDSRGLGRSGRGPWRPTPVMVCTRCGHEEHVGVLYGGDGAEPVGRVEGPPSELRPSLAYHGFPVYTVANPPARAEVCGGGHDREGVDSVHVSHRAHDDLWVRVDTTARHVPAVILEADVRWALMSAISTTGDWPRLSAGALGLWLQGREREREAAVARAERISVSVPVDGEPVTFEGLAADGAWAIAGMVGDHGVSVSGRGLAPGGLELVG